MIFEIYVLENVNNKRGMKAKEWRREREKTKKYQNMIRMRKKQGNKNGKNSKKTKIYSKNNIIGRYNAKSRDVNKDKGKTEKVEEQKKKKVRELISKPKKRYMKKMKEER